MVRRYLFIRRPSRPSAELSWKALTLSETIVERGAMSGPAVEINDLWFSYEVAEVIGGNTKAIDKDAHR